jgi:hypothetical protein
MGQAEMPTLLSNNDSYPYDEDRDMLLCFDVIWLVSGLLIETFLLAESRFLGNVCVGAAFG